MNITYASQSVSESISASATYAIDLCNYSISPDTIASNSDFSFYSDNWGT